MIHHKTQIQEYKIILFALLIYVNKIHVTCYVNTIVYTTQYITY